MSLAQISTPWMGVAAVQGAFTKMGWFFREQTVSDFGIDAQVEIVEGDKPVGREALVYASTSSSLCMSTGTVITVRR
jgi:hypothetical protein